MLKKLRPLSFIPLILMLSMIFSFSAQTGEDSGKLSYEISYRIIEVKNDILNENKTDEEIADDADSIHFYVRKAGHMTEYFVLALTIIVPLYIYNIRGKKLFWITLFLSACFAGLDEYHQSFVAGRGPSVKDVGIDSVGALIADTLSYILIRIGKRKK